MADVCYVVDDGMDIITNLLSGIGGTVPKYIAWGTGTTGAAATDTAVETLAAPTATTAVTGTPTRVTTSTTNDTYQVVGTVTAAGTLAITEVGICDAATISGANLFLHGTFSAINLSADDSIEFTIKSQFNQA